MRRAALIITAAALAFPSGCGPIDTHQSLLGAMLSCHEEVCSILESIHTVDDAKAAEPRISAQAKKYREYANRFLLLGLPDAAETQQLTEYFSDRERKLNERLIEAGKKLEQGNKDTILAVAVVVDDFRAARSDFELKRARLQAAKAMGKATTGADPAEIQQHDQVLTSIANRLTKITGFVAAMNDSESARRQVGPIQEATAGIKTDVEKFRALPSIRDVQLQIRLEPAKQRLNEAFKEYHRTVEEARKRPEVGGTLLRLDVDVSLAVHRLDAPQLPESAFKNMPTAGPTESAGARKAREMMEAARARHNLPPLPQPPRRP